jgi:DNA-binding winged helix-turn-helix (wHTH) protein
VHLTGKEYTILELLSLRKGSALTKEVFRNHLYGGLHEPGNKIIDVFICKLRKKLSNASRGKNYIETIRGRGYMLRSRAVTTVPSCMDNLKLKDPGRGCLPGSRQPLFNQGGPTETAENQSNHSEWSFL